MEADGSKVLMDLGGIPVLEHSLRLFDGMPEVREIIVVTHAEAEPDVKRVLQSRKRDLDQYKIVRGGARRCDSAAQGLAACSKDSILVLIHDGARPFPPEEAVREVILQAAKTGAAILATPLHDTLKRVSNDGIICETLPRENRFRAQTPQVFHRQLLSEAFEKTFKAGLAPTDDALILEAAGHQVRVVDGGPFNIKITTQQDLVLARAIARIRQGEE